MDRKQGIIHLGKSKSPKHRKDNSLSENSIHFRTPSASFSRDKEPLHETSILNQSMHLPAQQNAVKSQVIDFAHTHPGFFPPPFQTVQRVVVKENVLSPNQRNLILKQSPSRRVVVVEGSPHKSVKKISQATQRQVQLLRKIKMLETRVQELHKQKQETVVKSHEENRRLCLDNNVLQQRLAQTEGIKNKQISCLRQQVNNLQNALHSSRVPILPIQQAPPQIKQEQPQSTEKSHKQLKNLAYIDDQQDKISIKNHQFTQEQPVCQPSPKSQRTPQTHRTHQTNRIQELEEENASLKQEIEEMKNAIINISGIIEENNQKIVQNYEQKITMYAAELEKYKKLEEKQTDIKSLESSLEFSQQQLIQKQKQCENLKKQLEFSQKQVQDYVSKLLLKSQQMMKLESTFFGKIHDIQATSQINQQKNQQKIRQLQQQLQQHSSILFKTEEVKPVSQQSCPKCKQLIKTLVKLNQKSFSKTS